MARRFRYDRASVDSAVRAAKKLAVAQNAPAYVFATYFGWTIGAIGYWYVQTGREHAINLRNDVVAA